MGYGYAGRNASAIIETKYEYAGSEFYDASQLKDYLMYNLSMAKDTKTYKEHMPQIGQLAVEFAQDLIVKNGKYKTGRLWKSVRFKESSTGVTLFADARDNRGSAYAGHIEYGFVGRDGKPHGPWPFLRPAIRMAAEASKGVLAQEVAENILYGRYDSSISFGRADIDHLLNKGKVPSGYVNPNRSIHTEETRYMFGAHGGKSGRWTEAQHGIDHMGGLRSSSSKSGDGSYYSFQSTFGNSMGRENFKRGEL